MKIYSVNYFFILVYILLIPFMLQGQNVVSSNLPQGVLSPGQVNKSMVGQVLAVQGLVVKFEPTWNERYPNSVYLRDTAGNTLHVVYWKNIEEAIGTERTPKVGQLLRVKGQINEFRGEINLSITAPEDIVDAGSEVEEKVPIVPLSSITKDKLNQVVKIQGKVVNIRPSWKPTAPDIVTISDGSDVLVSVVYWSDVKDRLQPQDIPEVGKIILVEGWIDIYREQLQVKVDNPYKIKCVSGAPTLTASADSPSPPSSSSPSTSTPQEMLLASTNDVRMNSTPQSTSEPPKPAFGYANPFAPPKNTNTPQNQTSNTSNVNPMNTQSGSPASDFPVNQLSKVQNPVPQAPKGPGFYTIDKARAVIQGPPQRSHILFFTSQEHDPYSKDPLFLELSAKVVFVWVDFYESAHIVKQLNITDDPTWVYYDSNGYEQTRKTGVLTSAQLAESITLISN